MEFGILCILKSFMGKAGENVKTGVGFVKGPLGSRMSSREPGAVSADKHLLQQHSQKTSGTGQGCDRPQLQCLHPLLHLPIQEPQGYCVNDVNNTEKPICGFGMHCAQAVLFSS